MSAKKKVTHDKGEAPHTNKASGVRVTEYDSLTASFGRLLMHAASHGEVYEGAVDDIDNLRMARDNGLLGEIEIPDKATSGTPE